MSASYTTLQELPYISSDETGTYPSDLLSGWFEEDVDYDTNLLILEFAQRFNRMSDGQRLDFVEDAEKTVENKHVENKHVENKHVDKSKRRKFAPDFTRPCTMIDRDDSWHDAPDYW